MLFKTIDGGQHWQPIYKINSYIYYLDFLNGQNGWASTASALLHTIDGGKSWQTVHIGKTMSSHFYNETSGWAVMKIESELHPGPNKIFTTSNTGKTWFNLNTPCQTDNESEIGTVLDINNAWIVCGEFDLKHSGFLTKKLYFSTDNGHLWRIISQTNKNDQINSGTEISVPSFGTTNDLFFVDNNHGWFSSASRDGGGLLATTNDGGISWKRLKTTGLGVGSYENISNLHFVSLTWGFGNGPNPKTTQEEVHWEKDTLLITQDGGSTWTPMPTPEVLSSPDLPSGPADLVHPSPTPKPKPLAPEVDLADFSDPRKVYVQYL